MQGFPDDLRRRTQRKLEMIDGATSLEDSRNPPGNLLEKFRGNRDGRFSIRINDQWRVCFFWEDGDAFGVEVIDYHR